MTTNKPEVVAWSWDYRGQLMLTTVYSRALELAEPPYPTEVEPLIRLSDYEALQAECEKLREHLQNLIDQTTPLEPVPGNPMWSRRIQLDEVMAEREQLRDECERLRKSLILAGGLVPYPDPSCKCDECVEDAKMVAAIDAATQGDKP